MFGNADYHCSSLQTSKIPGRLTFGPPVGYTDADTSPIYPEVLPIYLQSLLIHPGSFLDVYTDVLLYSNYSYALFPIYSIQNGLLLNR